MTEMLSWSKQELRESGQCEKGSENTFRVVGTGQQRHEESTKSLGDGGGQSAVESEMCLGQSRVQHGCNIES